MKKILALVMAGSISCSTFAQFTTVTGLTLNISDKRPDNISIANGPSGAVNYYYVKSQATMVNLLIYPKYHFLGAAPKQASTRSKRKPEPPKPFSLSAGLPLQIGMNFGGGSNGFSFAYAAGLASDINFGNFRANDNESVAGFFAGAGFGVMNTNQLSVDPNVPQLPVKPAGNPPLYASFTEFENTFKYRGLSIGPLVHLGAQIETGRSTIGIRAGYQIGLNSFGKDYTSITIIYTGGGFMNNNMMFW
jgi:hypothetical protein